MQVVKDPRGSIDMEYGQKRNTQLLVYFNKIEPRLTGEFRHLFSTEFTKFRSISEFIFKAELMMEELDCPRAPLELRKTWGKEKEGKKTFCLKPRLLEVPPMGGMKRGKECFLINVKYRQNTSWQGQIRWMGKDNDRMTFRSVLELIMILEHSMDGEMFLPDTDLE